MKIVNISGGRKSVKRPLASGLSIVAWLLTLTVMPLIGLSPAQAAPQASALLDAKTVNPPSQKLPAAEKIVSDYLKAVGGKKRVAAVRDATYEWIVRVGEREAGQARTQIKSPDALRSDLVFREAGEINTAANSRSAWTRSLEGNLRTLTDMEAGAAKLQAALVASGFVDYKKQNVLARTLGVEQLHGERAYLVEFSTRAGARLRCWFSASSKLLWQMRDDVQRVTMRFGDYRARATSHAPLEPYRIELQLEGNEALTLTLQSARYNTGLSDNIFEPPGVAGLDIPALLREVARNQGELDARVSEYTFMRKQVEREINDRGELKKEKITVHEIYPVMGGGQVLKLLSEDGVALSPERAAKEEKRVAEELMKAEREFTKQEQKRARERDERAKKKNATGAGENGDDDLGIAEFFRASEFVSPRRERFRERDAIVFDFRARPGFRPTNKEEALIAKLTGVVWIDPVDKQVMRLEARLEQAYKIGAGLLASVRPGSHFAFEQARMDEGLWLPRFSQISASAKVLIFAGFRLDATQEFSDYKRFTTKSGDAILDAPKPQP